MALSAVLGIAWKARLGIKLFARGASVSLTGVFGHCVAQFGVALQLRDHDLSETQSLIRVQYEQGIKIGNRVGTAILGADLCTFDRLTPEEPPIQAL